MPTSVDAPTVTLPDWTPGAQARRAAAYHYSRIQFPSLAVSADSFRAHLERAMLTYLPKLPKPMEWIEFFDGLYALDWTICCGCVDGLDRAWEILFNTRTGRSDCLLVDALRARATRLYPRDEDKQENAVAEFWSHLLVPDSGGSRPVLQRYDGQRPLAPWLIRVFQNWHLSKLRVHHPVITLPDDDIAWPIPTQRTTETRWHEFFVMAARRWLVELPDSERLILGLRWRYRMSQREVANLLKVHEGTISRQTDKLRDHALEVIGEQLVADGWTGDDLNAYILTEMGGVLLDDPRLSAEQLQRLLHAKGLAVKTEPEA